jgi:hypothetical protein
VHTRKDRVAKKMHAFSNRVRVARTHSRRPNRQEACETRAHARAQRPSRLTAPRSRQPRRWHTRNKRTRYAIRSSPLSTLPNNLRDEQMAAGSGGFRQPQTATAPSNPSVLSHSSTLGRSPSNSSALQKLPTVRPAASSASLPSACAALSAAAVSLRLGSAPSHLARRAGRSVRAKAPLAAAPPRTLPSSSGALGMSRLAGWE